MTFTLAADGPLGQAHLQGPPPRSLGLCNALLGLLTAERSVPLSLSIIRHFPLLQPFLLPSVWHVPSQIFPGGLKRRDKKKPPHFEECGG